ncbi:MAG: response regulator [SAR324 cluster bacterium]|nr:response regulator [SAR324 cluster bacterium]
MTLSAKDLLEWTRGLNILYVEDDQALRASTHALLANFFDPIDIAEDGAIGLKMTREKDYDLIITDIRMPNMDGIEMSREIKAQNFETPILVISAHDEASYLMELINIGVDSFLSKPLDLKHLLPALNKLCHGIQLKKQEKEYQEKLAQLNRDKDKFFSIISHDLKSPFNGIMGLLELLSSEDNDFSKKEAAIASSEIYLAAKRFYSLLENLLDWSRMQQGKVEPHAVVVNLESLIEDRVDILKAFANQKTITLRNNISADFEVFADQTMTGSVIHNLVSNGIKFTHKGGKINLDAEYQGDYILIRVTDSGVGMKPETVEQLFRIDISHSTLGTANEKGTGLGLQLCKEMVELQGGSLGVESTLGTGTCFYFTLPKPTNKTV